MRSILTIALFLFCLSCAKTNTEQSEEAIDIALTYLSDSNCSAAIKVLESAGRDTSNPVYLQVLASAYACRAGFDEVHFLSTDIPAINSTALGFMKSLSKLSLSYESAANSSDYKDFLVGINALINVDSSQPSQLNRDTKYGPRKSGDMGIQALFLSLVQLGKFLNYYGNVDTNGVKGSGAANTDEQGATPSTCFINYTEARSVVFLGSGGGGVCNDMNTDLGHPDLSLAAGSLTATKKKMCEGLMLVTNIIDILSHLTLPGSSSYGSLTTLPATVSTFKSTIIAADATLTTLLNTTDQTTCESLVASASEFDNLQFIYAMLFEGGLQ